MMDGTLATHDLIFAIRLSTYSCKLQQVQIRIQILITLFIHTENNHSINAINVICYYGNQYSQ